MIGLAVATVAALVLTLVWFQVWWADWVVQTLFHKDYNNWIILLGLFVFELLTPNKLSGLSSIILFLSTLYIWLVL
jgi:hypothetical protein